MRWAIALAATASVGERTAPSTKAMGQGRPSRTWLTMATPAVVKSTRPMASSKIGRRLARNSRQEICQAEE